VKDSYQVIDELKTLGPLPSHSRLFTCDAVSMYTNIDSSHGPELIEKWLEENNNEIPADFPKTLLIKVLKVVMTSNIFQFDDTFWLQTCGTSMGTSCACTYATLYWAFIERKHIIPKWKNQLFFLRCFIDDEFGIWLGQKEDFDLFQQDLNSYCQLKWTSDGLQKTVNFLDLTITINGNGLLTTKTYQKPTNLHLYLPPTSAHPPGVLKSLIYGNLQRFWLQNTLVTDYIDIAKQFAEHLIARGHKREKITAIFEAAATKLDKLLQKKKERKDVGETLFLHWTWHPRCISRPKLRLLYNETLQERSGFHNLIICYSRPKILEIS
jgi:hypothetical protein